MGCTEAVFCPGPSVGVVGLDPKLGPDLLPETVVDAYLMLTPLRPGVTLPTATRKTDSLTLAMESKHSLRRTSRQNWKGAKNY